MIVRVFASANTLKPGPNQQLKPLTSSSARASRQQMAKLAADCTQKTTCKIMVNFLDRLRTVTDPGLRARIFTNVGVSQTEMQNNPSSPIAGSQKMQALLRNMAMFCKDQTNPAVTSIVNDYDRREMLLKKSG